jgi:hypothetical protein
MGLARLQDVYNPMKKQPEAESASEECAADRAPAPPPAPPLALFHRGQGRMNSWQDSAPVMELSEYLKQCKAYGFKLYASERHPTIRFTPGLKKADIDGKTERGVATRRALELLDNAACDLHYLLTEGLLNLPTIKKGV